LLSLSLSRSCFALCRPWRARSRDRESRIPRASSGFPAASPVDDLMAAGLRRDSVAVF
jgi:hypothetical protein